MNSPTIHPLKELITGALERELRPVGPVRVANASAILRAVRQLAKVNAASWDPHVDSVEAVREQRRG